MRRVREKFTPRGRCFSSSNLSSARVYCTCRVREMRRVREKFTPRGRCFSSSSSSPRACICTCRVRDMGGGPGKVDTCEQPRGANFLLDLLGPRVLCTEGRSVQPDTEPR